MTLKKSIIVIFTVIVLSCRLIGAENSKRPVQLEFYVNSHLNTTTIIEYNKNGDLLKMSSYENGKVTDYARYRYDSNARLLSENCYDPFSVLLKTRKYQYDDTGLITGEKVYSPSGKLIEYLVLTYNSRKIQKIDYYKSDDNLFQSIEFVYFDGRVDAMAFNRIGKYVMYMKAVYDDNTFLIGHNIKHSNADIKIETRYIYEAGYATDTALQIIFR